MGDDDKLLPNCLEEYNKLIIKYPDLDVYHGWTEIIDEESKPYCMQEPRPEREGMFSMIWNRWKGRRQYVGDFCYRKKSLIDAGGYFYLPYAWGSDDITAYIMCGSKGIANTQVPIFYYRSNRQSISSTGDIRGKIDAIIDEKAKMKELLLMSPSDDVERIYKRMAFSNIDNHFRTKIKNCMIEDISKKGLLVWWHWLLNRKQYQISTTYAIWIGVLSLKKYFIKRNKQYKSHK